MKIARGELEVGRFRVPYRRYGEDDDVFLCVSGALQTMGAWAPVAKRFCRDFTVVVFDMPGVGRSEILRGPPRVSVDEQLEVVDAIVADAQVRGRLALAGSSWGTAIAAAWAARHPDAVDRLVLSSFGLSSNATLQAIVDRAEALYTARDYAGGGDLILELIGARVSPAYKRQIVAQFSALTDASAASFVEHCRNVLSLGRLQDEVDLTRIRARTLIVNGADDVIIDPNDMWAAKALIPDCECLMVEGVGHFLTFERPELLEDYAAFLLAPPQRAVG